MVTTTKEQAGTCAQPTQFPPIDDFRSLLSAVPGAKADALKERIYDWLEKREGDAEVAIEKAKARATIVEEQNRIVRMELQDIENDRLREEAATTRRARAALFAEAMSALNAQDPAAPKEREETSEDENDDQGVVPAEYQQPTDSSATTHPLQPLGADIGRKVHAGNTTALDIVIKELLDEVMQLREGASANVARVLMLEDQLQAVNDALATQSALLDEAMLAQKDTYYREGWGTGAGTSQVTPSTKTTIAPLTFWREEKGQESKRMSDPWTGEHTPSLSARPPLYPSLEDLDPTPIRGYLGGDSDVPRHEFDSCYKKYQDMMLLLQLTATNEPIAYHEIPWPILPYNPEGKFPVPRWRARYAEREDVDKFVEGFLASKHAETWRGSMKEDWLDLLGCTLDDSVKEIVETMVGFLG
jgi:hypothetical protein